MPSTVWVTPSLYVGEPPNLSRTAKVTSADEALTVIAQGGIAVLPPGSSQEAEKVLAHFGVDETTRMERTASLR